MESKKINQLATELAPELSDLTIIGDPTTGISKKITLSQMASLFTGTVEEYANLASFPLVGTADTIYIALDTNIIYRWNTGTSAYVELSPNIVTSLVFNDANGFDGTISLVGSTATLTITTALTQGSIGFIGASGALTQDNSNFFWDNTNKRLGINTNAPTTAIDAFGSGIIGRLNGTSTNNAFLGFASAGSNKWSIGNVQSDHRFRIYSEANAAELVSVLQTGEVGIGIANPLTKLHIFGGASALIANLDANTSVAKSISFRSGNSSRINLEVSGTESGSNAGADLFIRRYSDAGALIGTALYLQRSTGNFGFGGTTITDSNLLNIIGDSASVNIGVVLNNTNSTNAKIYGIQNVGKSLVFYDYSSNASRISIANTGIVTVSGTLVAGAANGNIRLTGSTDGFIGAGASDGKLYVADWATGAKGLSITLATGAATFSNSVGTTALNMNNMSALGSISGGSIYLPYTATINFRSADGQNGYGAITADTSSNLILNNKVGIGMTPDVDLQVKAISGNITTFRIGPSASGFELSQDNGGFTSCTIKNIYSTTNSSAELSIQSGFITFKTGTSLNERIRINAVGTIGIGWQGYSTVKLAIRGVDQTSSNYGIIIDNAVVDTFYVRNDGEIKTGTAAYSPYNNTTSSGANLVVASSGILLRSTSSLKYKKDIKSYDKGILEVMKMNPVYYKGINDGNIQFAGLIAEEIHDLGLTEFVQYAEDGTPDALSYQNMVALLTKAIQELKAEIDSLKNN